MTYPETFFYIFGKDATAIGDNPPIFIRVNQAYGPLPDTFPAGASYINNENFPDIWLRKA